MTYGTQGNIEHPLQAFGWSRPPHWLWRLSPRACMAAAAIKDIWLILRGKLTLHRAWQEGLDHGTASEYRRIIINGGDLVPVMSESFNCGLEAAAHRMETANDETPRYCIIEAVRAMKRNVRAASH